MMSPFFGAIQNHRARHMHDKCARNHYSLFSKSGMQYEGCSAMDGLCDQLISDSHVSAGQARRSPKNSTATQRTENCV